MKPLVIVLARSHATALSVIRSLGAEGYPVELVSSTYRKGGAIIAASSKYVRSSVEVIHNKVKEGQGKAAATLIEELMKRAGQNGTKPVLFPTDDYTTSVIDTHRSELEPHFLMPSIVGGKDGALMQCMDKSVQAEMARQAGLLVPREWVFDLNQELIVPEDMVFPCYCKPTKSIAGYKGEMAACRDEAEFLAHMSKLRSHFADRSILVQEFLNIDYEIDLSGVCLDQEVIIPAIIRKTRVAQHARGVTLSGKTAPFEELGDLQEKIIRLLKQFRYIGMFDMELTVVGDRIYFNEVNLRSGGPNYAYYQSGVNLPALFVKEILGTRHLPEEEKVRECGKSFINEKVAWDDYIHGYMTGKELRQAFAQADYKLMDNKADPMPQMMFHLWMYLRTIRRGRDPVIRQRRKERIESLKRLEAQKPRVIVAGRNYASNLCLARAFGKAGYDVEVIRIREQVSPFKKHLFILYPDAFSRYIKKFHLCVTNKDEAVFVDKLRKLADPKRKTLLIPADDLGVSIVDEHYDELKKLYVIPNVDDRQGEINRLMNKRTQMELAAAAGLPVIHSCVIPVRQGQIEIPDTVHYPCFIKPNVSKNGRKTIMKKCESREELQDALAQVATEFDLDMKVEDFVDIRREYAILGLSTKDGVIAPGFFCTEAGGHGGWRGVALSGRVLPRDDQKELIDHVCSFIKTLNYEGLFDVDLIEAVDGTVYFVELNLRYGGSGYAIVESGANLPGMFADYMLKNKPVNMGCSVQPGKTFVNERVLLGEYKESYLTRSDVKEWMKKVDIHFIYDEKDPAAFRCFRCIVALTPVQKLLMKIRAKK